MNIGFTHCLQIFPTADLGQTAQFYERFGFRAVYVLDAAEPHVCLYRDSIEIVLTRSSLEQIQPNRIVHGYGYDAYFITDNQQALEEECKQKGIKIVRPLTTTDYNNKEFVFEDVDGRWIAVGKKQTA